MAGGVCVRKEGLFLRNYHHRPMSVHVLQQTIDEEGEHQHEGALLGELVGEHWVKRVRRPANPWVALPRRCDAISKIPSHVFRALTEVRAACGGLYTVPVKAVCPLTSFVNTHFAWCSDAADLLVQTDCVFAAPLTFPFPPHTAGQP